MDFESWWYEVFPFVYGAGGLACLLWPGSTGLLRLSGALLLVVSLVVLRRRWSYRRALYIELVQPRASKPSEGAARPTVDGDGVTLA